MTFLWASRAKLIKVICASLLAHLWPEVTVDEQSEHPVSQTMLYMEYNPHSDVVIVLALVSLAFLLRIFSDFTSESQEPQEQTRKDRRRRARGKSPTQPLRRSARLLAKSQGKQF